MSLGPGGWDPRNQHMMAYNIVWACCMVLVAICGVQGLQVWLFGLVLLSAWAWLELKG